MRPPCSGCQSLAIVAIPCAFDFVGCECVTPLPAKMSLILPTPSTVKPLSEIAFSTVADKFDVRFLFYRAEKFPREFFKRRERLIENHARNFPVPCRGIFARGPLAHSAVTRVTRFRSRTTGAENFA